MNYENYDPCFPDQPVVDLYLPTWAQLPSFRSKPAFIWTEDGSTRSDLSYEQLNNSVHSISSNLQASLQKGDTVVILCPPGLELVEVIFGCQRSGLLAVPVIPPDTTFANQNHHHLVRVLSQTKPKAAIAKFGYIQQVKQYLASSSPNNTKLAQLLQKLRWIAIEDVKGNEVCIVKGEGFFASYNGCKADDLYLIQYTSGATGIPKPVLVTAGSAAHNVRTARKAYDLHPNSVIVSWLPQYHDCGLVFLLLTIVSGATCVLTSPNAFINRPRLWLEMITEYRATCTPVPSFTLPLVVKRGGVDIGSIPIHLGSMKNLIIINEPIYNSAIQEFLEVFTPFGLRPEAISPSYGLAENCTFVSTAWRSNKIGNFPIYKKLLPSARLQYSAIDDEEDSQILVVNEETNEPVEDGEEGEIWVASPSNASGYLDHPSLTNQVFHGRLKNKVSQCFVRTGDRGVIKGEERYLFVTGRTSDTIKLPNQKSIHPHYIETVAYESCKECLRGGCIAAFDLSGSLAIVAEMQKSKSDLRTMRAICEGIKRAIMHEEGVAIGLVVLVKGGSVPKTTSGKLQRWLARDKLARGELEVMQQMGFDNNAYGTTSAQKMIIHASNAKRGTTKAGNQDRKVVADNTEEIAMSFSNAPTHPSLRSSL